MTHILFFMLSSAADDPTDHVSALRLGSDQQRCHRVLLVRNTIQGTSCFITITSQIILVFVVRVLSDHMKQHLSLVWIVIMWWLFHISNAPWLCSLLITRHKDNINSHINCILHIFCFPALGTLPTLGHPGLQLHHWRLVSHFSYDKLNHRYILNTLLHKCTSSLFTLIGNGMTRSNI